MGQRRHLLNGIIALPDPNTFIGGVGASYITTAAEMAAVTSLNESDIQNFVVNGSNQVSFYTEVEYQLGNNSFQNASGCTYYIDLDGKVTSTDSATGDNNDVIEYLYFPNLLTIDQLFFQNSNSLKRVNLQGTLEITKRYLFNNDNLIKKIDLSSVTSMPYVGGFGGLTGLSGLERLKLSNITSVSNDLTEMMMVRASNRFFFLLNINTSCKVYANSYLGIQDRNSFANISGDNLSVGEVLTINGLTYTGVAGATSTEGEFQADVGNNTKTLNLANAINTDTRIGTYSKCYAYYNSSSLAVYVDAIGVAGDSVGISSTGSSVLNSFRGGNDVHPLILYPKERGCTITIVDPPITVDPPTGLNATNQTATSVDLNFTAPTPNANGIDGYEVWVDDGTVYRYLFEYDEITTSGDILDLTEVGSLTGVKIKIRTIDGQMNFSNFSNEITLL